MTHLSKFLTGERQAFGAPSYLSCKVMSCATPAPLTIFQDSQCLICIANNGREVLLLISQRPELTILKGRVCMWFLVHGSLWQSTMSSFWEEAMGTEHMHIRDRSTRTIFSSCLSPGSCFSTFECKPLAFT